MYGDRVNLVAKREYYLYIGLNFKISYAKIGRTEKLEIHMETMLHSVNEERFDKKFANDKEEDSYSQVSSLDGMYGFDMPDTPKKEHLTQAIEALVLLLKSK
jgi:hypothetical protein